MNGELVSIVVPVYNVAPYLDQCITSILRQTYQNIEIILVNDGSTDGSGEICKKYSQMDSRIKLISQNNQGVVIARKNGVAQASGEYVGFVDADDYIDSDLYQQLMGCSEDFDLVVAQWYREETNNTRRCYDRIALGAYRTQADLDFLLDNLVNVSTAGGGVNIKSGFVPYLMTKLWKTSIAKEVFDEVEETLSFSEDGEFTYRYFLKAQSVLITDICGYHYRIRPGSAAHMDGNAASVCRYLENIRKFYQTVFPVFAAHPRHLSLIPQLEIKTVAMLSKLQVKMGFPPEAQNRAIVFPFMNLLDNKRIALYGAGEIGNAYLRQIQKFGSCEIALWVDERWQELQRAGWDVSPVESLADGLYDYIVIAVETEDKAMDMRARLTAMGIGESTVLWRKPLIL